MTISSNDALEELKEIRTELDNINQKKFKFYQGGKKRNEIRKLVDTLDIVLMSSDPDYEKGDILENAPQPTVINASSITGEQEIDATAKRWSQYLLNQLDLYEKRLKLLSKSIPPANVESQKSSKQSSQVFEKVENYFHYNPVVNITTITEHIDQVILELDKETNLDSKTKEEIKSKLQQAKNFIKNIGDETAPIAGKFIGQTLRSFLFGNDN